MEELVELPNGVLMEPVPAYEQDYPVMALAVAKEQKKGRYQGIVREITSREGNNEKPGFIDKSKLFVVESENLLRWKRKDKLEINGVKEVIRGLQGRSMEFIGLEDPDIYFDGKTMHAYFSISFLLDNKKEEYAVYLGHAQGTSLKNLKATSPVLSPDLTRLESCSGFKEVAISPVLVNGKRMNLCESGYFDKENNYGVSTIVLASSRGFGGKWEFLRIVADPPKTNLEWCLGHLSPGPFFSPDFLRHKDLLVGIVNGRSANRREGSKLTYGRFSVGLLLFNPKTGEIPWISPEPLLSDPDAETITFASDFVQTDKENGILYAHVDDSFVRAYRLNARVLKEFLPKS